MPRFNQLYAQYNASGLEMLSVNYVNTDVEIQDFITTYGANYSFARVVDDSGYTVPQFSTCFAIGRDGRLLWTGYSDSITDQMVEGWLAVGQGGGGGDDEEDDKGCAGRGGSTTSGLVLLAALAVFSRRRARRLKV